MEAECIVINVGINTMQYVNARFSETVPLKDLCNSVGQMLTDFFIPHIRQELVMSTLHELPVANASRTEEENNLDG